jgi:RNA polymerase sigma-70 factor (ECF subfamily)
MTAMNRQLVLPVIVSMADAPSTTFGELPGDADAAVGELYSCHARALHDYIERLCPDPASVEDIVQETFIRAWHHLPHLRAEDRPVRPWLLRVARNLLIDAGRAARSRPVTVHGQLAERGCADTGLDRVLDRQLVTGALRQLSPAHRTVLVETFYCDSTLATTARRLGIPDGTARSRLHYGLQALRRHLRDQGATARG